MHGGVKFYRGAAAVGRGSSCASMHMSSDSWVARRMNWSERPFGQPCSRAKPKEGTRDRPWSPRLASRELREKAWQTPAGVRRVFADQNDGWTWCALLVLPAPRM